MTSHQINHFISVPPHHLIGMNQGVPVVCVVVEGGPAVVTTVLDYVSSNPPVPVFVFEGSGKAADLFAFLHKQSAMDRYSYGIFVLKGTYYTTRCECD